MDSMQLKKNELSVEEYEFTKFEDFDESGEVKNYNFKSFKDDVFLKPDHKERIKIERKHAKKNNFKIAPVVLEHRGINTQEEDEREIRIADEVKRRIEKIREDAYQEGLQQGVADGKREIYEEMKHESEEKLMILSDMVNEVLHTKSEILIEQKKEVLEMIKTLTKWVILREISDDGEYLERLLEKLIMEMQSSKNLLIQVDENSFSDMPEVLEVVKKRFQEMENVRLELDYDIKGKGIIVESENGIINGTLKQQFKNLSKLFESVGLGQDRSHEEVEEIVTENKVVEAIAEEEVAIEEASHEDIETLETKDSAEVVEEASEDKIEENEDLNIEQNDEEGDSDE